MKNVKRLMIVLLCGFILAPFNAWGQKWVEPHTDSDGSFVEGHWQTPEDLRKDQYSTPGKVNPYTGQFSPYSGSNLKGPKPATPTPMPSPPFMQNPYYPQQDYRYRGN